MKKHKFSVIIANFNGQRYLNDCLSSVYETTYPEFEVILVEDGSTDDSAKIIKKFQGKNNFQLISNSKNLGLVASRNKAIEKANGDILVFLDNDTRVDKEWLKGLAETFCKDPLLAALQCKIFDFKKPEIIQEVGMKLTPYTGFGNPLGRGQLDHGQFDSPKEVIALGAGLAVKKTVALKVKGFDQKLFHYTDDLDFSWRIWIAGYKIAFSPQAKIYHHTKVHNPTRDIYFHLCKNSIRMIIKNYEAVNVIKFLPLSLIFNITGGIFVFLRTGSLVGILGVLQGLGWSILFLKNTLKERDITQELRRVKDRDLFKKIMTTQNLFKTYTSYFKTARITDSLMQDNQ